MRIDAKTKVFCVIGDPIEHSLSPPMHNAVFEKLNLGCVYVAFMVKQADLKDALKGFKALGIRGINVTIPHKVAVIKYLDRLSEEARIIGAVNTIKIGEEVVGYNTDGIGALRALREGGADPEDKNVLILGSGGAARAISVTLALQGNVNSIMILGIDKDELLRLIADITKKTGINASGKIMTEDTKKEEIMKADILIHCTPVGMYPRIDESLVTAEMLKEDLHVMDIVYTPRETKLLKEAKKAGCNTIEGLWMFIYQAAESEKIWLGVDAPVDLMKEVVVKELER